MSVAHKKKKKAQIPKTLKNLLNNLLKNWSQWKDFCFMVERFAPYIKKNSKRLLLAYAASMGYVFMGMLEPWPLKLIFDNVFFRETFPVAFGYVFAPIQSKPIILLSVLIGSIILIAFVRGIFYYFQQLLMARAGQQIMALIRVDLYEHLQGLSFSFHDRRKTGDLLSRLTTDIRILRGSLVSLPLTMLSEVALMVGMMAIMFFMDWQLSLIALLVIPLLVLLLRKYQQPLKQAIRKQREREGHLASIAAEVFGAIKVVQGFQREQSEVERFTVQNKSSLRSGLKASRLEAKLKWASELAVALVTAVVLGVAAHRVLAGKLSPGDVLVFIAYLKAFNRPLRRISRFTERVARGTASGERILHLLKINPSVVDLPHARPLLSKPGVIAYKNVCFTYKNEHKNVLTDISFTINPGEKVAFVGHTGCGKSSLISLLPRFYEPQKGTITIGEQNIGECTLKSLRENIAFVFQEPVLFSTTISENIGYGRCDATEEDIVEAAKRARIHHIISSLPEGYDTILGERGGTLSGGQRQCIAIARAMIKNSSIVILDEPTSGLDRASAALVMNALKELMKEKTVLIVSHKLETVQDVDRVIMLDSGRIVQEGSFDELFGNQPVALGNKE